MSKMRNAELAIAVIRLLPGAELCTDRDDNWRVYFRWHGLNWVIHNDNSNASKFRIFVSSPRYKPEGSVYLIDKKWKELTTEIGVANTKTAERIAADIQRRFDVPALVAVADEYRQASDDQNKLIADSKALAQKLAKATGWRLYSSPQNDTEHETSNLQYGNCYAELKVSGLNVSAEIRSIGNEAKALELAAKLAELFN